MEQYLLEMLSHTSGPVAYALVFGLLLGCGVGLPLPEDVALVGGGYLSYQGHANLYVMLVVGFAGILVGDACVFLLGRAGRRAQGRHPGGLLSRHLSPERIAKVEVQFERRGALMVMIARFLPGVRAATYFVAGGARMSLGKFLLFDGLAALLSAPLFVLLGHHFGGEIQDVIGWAEEFHWWLVGGMAVIAVAWFSRAMARKRKLEPPEVVEAAAAPIVEPTPTPTPARVASDAQRIAG